MPPQDADGIHCEELVRKTMFPVRKLPVRLLVTHAADEMYGSDAVLLGLLSGLSKDEFQPIVFLPRDISYEGLLSAKLRQLGIETHTVSWLPVLRRKYFTPLGVVRYASRMLFAIGTFLSVIRQRDVDIIYSHTSAVLAGALAARLAGRPHVWHILEITESPRFMRDVMARLIPCLSTRAVATSEAVRAHLCRLYPPCCRDLVVLHNGVDAEKFHPGVSGNRVREELGLTPDQLLIGMAGRVGAWKGQEFLLDAVPSIVTQCPNVRFLLAGGVFDNRHEALEALRDRVLQLGLGEIVIISDFRRDMPEVLAALDVFVQPSMKPDPFPTALLEAMSAGKPIVSTAWGGPAEMVVEGETGLLVPPGDVPSLVAAICLLLKDPVLRTRMGNAGRRRLLERFSQTAFIEQYSRLLRDLAGNGKQASTRARLACSDSDMEPGE